MRALVGVETALLLLLTVLVAGLLRSHAEILRTLHRLGVGPHEGAGPGPTPVALANRADGSRAHDVAGVTPTGDAVHIGVSGRQPTLLAFLSSGCATCQPLWDGLHRGEPGLPDLGRVVAVTRGPAAESPGRLAPLSPPGVAVVMSDEAWADYAVPGAPYVVYVDGGRVAGEGSVQGWDQLRSLLARAAADARTAPAGMGSPLGEEAGPAAPAGAESTAPAGMGSPLGEEAGPAAPAGAESTAPAGMGTPLGEEAGPAAPAGAESTAPAGMGTPLGEEAGVGAPAGAESTDPA